MYVTRNFKYFENDFAKTRRQRSVIESAGTAGQAHGDCFVVFTLHRLHGNTGCFA